MLTQAGLRQKKILEVYREPAATQYSRPTGYSSVGSFEHQIPQSVDFSWHMSLATSHNNYCAMLESALHDCKVL